MMPFTRFQEVHPVLPVLDVRQAVEYFIDRLGFEFMDIESSDEPAYAGIRRGEAQLYLERTDADRLPSKGTIVLRFVVDDADDLFDEYENREVFEPNTQLRDTPRGTREFEFCEPNGAKLVFLMTVPE
jgi:hypothetical protein